MHRQKLGYVPALDGLRALAVLLVAARHLGAPVLVGAGDVGVGIFFALSGFLITTLLLEEQAGTGRVRLPAFYLRRTVRLMPGLIVMMVVVVPLSAIVNHNADTAKQAFFAALYIGNWAKIQGWLHGHALGHTWSLAVEEHFYLVWPLVLALALLWGGRRRALQAALTLTLASLGWRLWLYVHEAAPIRLQYGSDTRADSLLIGCVAALAFAGRRPPLPPRVAHVAWATLGLLLFVPTRSLPVLTVGLSVLAVAGAVIVLDTVQGSSLPARLLTLPPLVGLGRVSYGFYLWHMPVFMLLRDRLPQSAPVQSLLLLVLTLALALLSYDFVERPVLAWNARRTHRPAPLRLAGLAEVHPREREPQPVEGTDRVGRADDKVRVLQ